MSRVIADGLSKKGEADTFGRFGIGEETPTKEVFTGVEEYSKVAGGRGFIGKDSPNAPDSNENFYYEVIARRDINGGYGAIAIAQDINTREMWFASVDNDSTAPIWNRMFHQRNIVGTVSGTGATPTGAIIERGSNANGEYTKYADGTVKCWAVIKFEFSTGTTLAKDWTLPANGVFGTPFVFFVSPVRYNSSGTNDENLGTVPLLSYFKSGFADAQTASNGGQIRLRAYLPDSEANAYVSGNYAWACIYAVSRWF